MANNEQSSPQPGDQPPQDGKENPVLAEANEIPDAPSGEPIVPVAAGSPPIMRRLAITSATTIGLIVLAQLVAPATDHQYANMASFAIGFIGVLVAVFQVHRLASRAGSQRVVPAVTLATVAGLVVCFQFQGFSGEMFPQFRFRFRGDNLKPRSVSDTATNEDTESDFAPDAATSTASSAGFLGSNRRGVDSSRRFAIPTSQDEIQVLWNQGIGEGWSSFAVESNRAVTLEQRDDEEWLSCYRLADGEMLWKQSIEARHEDTLGGIGPRSTPTIDDGIVYAQSATGYVWSVNLETGETRWTHDLLDSAGWTQLQSEALITWGRSGSPAIVDSGDRKLCVLPYGGPLGNELTGRSLIALDAETGDVVWTAGEDNISYASPTVMTLAGQKQIVIVNEVTISGHAIDTGKQLWSFEWLGKSNANANCASVVPAGENRFLVGKGYGGGSALVEVTLQGGEMQAEAVWAKSNILKTKFTHACVVGNIAYAISNGSLEAVDLEQGKRLWSQPRRSRFQQGQILLADDVIIGQAEDGDVAFVSVTPDRYEEILRIDAMDSKTWNVPTIAGRHLLVRNDRQAICFLLPPAGN